MVDREHDARRVVVGALGARAAVLDDPDVAVRRRVVDVEAARSRRSRARRRATAGRARRRTRSGRRCRGTAASSCLAAAHDPHGAALLDHEDAPAVAGRSGHVDRAVERADPLQAQPGPRGRGGRASAGRPSRSATGVARGGRGARGGVAVAAAAEREQRRPRAMSTRTPHPFKDDRRGARARRSPAPRLSCPCSLLPPPREPNAPEAGNLRSAAYETLEQVLELSRRIARQAGVHRRRLHDRARRRSQPVEALRRRQRRDRPAVRRRRPPRARASPGARARHRARSRAPAPPARPRRAPSSRPGSRAGGRTGPRRRSGTRRARRAARRGRSRTGSPHARARSASSIHSRGASSRRSRCSA